MSDKNRVKKRRDFTRVYQKGKSAAAKDLVLCWRKTGLPVHRVGFTVSKKVG
ncbi:MAG: ribonuclease P protein component, partial [Clostridia bacterium]